MNKNLKSFILFMTTISLMLGGVLAFSEYANPDHFNPYIEADAPLFEMSVRADEATPIQVCEAMLIAFHADQTGRPEDEVTDLLDYTYDLAEELGPEHEWLAGVAKTAVNAWHSYDMLTLEISLVNLRDYCDQLPGFDPEFTVT